MEILGSDGENRPILPLTRATRDALARYVAINAPNGRRKWAQAEWDLTSDEARGVCEASASATTIDKIWKHPRGGWAVLLPVMAAVIGHSVDDFLINERRKHVDQARRHRAIVRDLRTLAGDRGADHPDVGSPRAGRRGAGADRKAQGPSR